MTMLTVIAYKPNSSCSYRNCVVDRYDSNCVVLSGDNLDAIASNLAIVIEPALGDQETGYDLTFIVDGVIILNTEGDTDYSTYLEPDSDDYAYDHETEFRNESFVQEFRDLLSGKITEIVQKRIEQLKKAEEERARIAEKQRQSVAEIKTNLEIQQLKELAAKYPDVLKENK